MSALQIVRKIKSALDAGPLNSISPHQDGDERPQSTNDEQAPSSRTRLGKPLHNLRNTRVSSIGSQSSGTLRSQPERSFVDLRRRLARKASLLGLRAKWWKAEIQGREQEQENNRSSPAPTAEEALQQGRPFPCKAKDSDNPVLTIQPYNYSKASERDLAPPDQDHDTFPASSLVTIQPPPILPDFIQSHHIRPDPIQTNQAAPASKPTKPRDQSDLVQAHILAQQANYLREEIADGIISINMSGEQAPPPVPYTRLKEITENACSSALSSVTSYSHAETESWNTTIINSILGALVEETSKSGSASSSQPQFKYVVNSTIIQHASSSSDSPRTAGRRGMHAASGAYWNNEKDGMWSYKYPGAESKGLDVVVGIIWIWVGPV
ncbi:hypothetical protein PV08_08532 [Exophiala spinifera]|uniref:Uncharacterized protein n=1 Tax=Exophiala spinifera TaxID=91928 RepID=A0A0D2BQD2_9EURO|nr:uncharacterized protein PV08_08532 [Exophiala spinifera]KIW13344.1 hypothetical protein PV08_08532 [Exophiala spinifera]